MSNFILEKDLIHFIPFEPKDADLIYKWQFDKRYAEFFRNSGFLSFAECQVYPQRMNALVFIIYVGEQPIGLIQAISQTMKNNKSFFAGILIEEEYQHQKYCAAAYNLLFDIMCNKYNFEKGIVEVLAHRKDIIHLLNNAGFVFEGLLKNEVFFNGKLCDEVRYAMSRTYYNKHHNKE